MHFCTLKNKPQPPYKLFVYSTVSLIRSPIYGHPANPDGPFMEVTGHFNLLCTRVQAIKACRLQN